MNRTLSIIGYIETGLVLGLSLYVSLITRNENVIFSSTLLILSVLFVVARLTNILFPQQLNRLLLFVLTVYCGFETIYGFSQLFGINYSNNYLFTLTGSFENPGPYGGFLAVGISILGAYALKNKSHLRKHSWTNISYLLLLIVVIASVIILPSTQSRTAILALICSAVCFVIRRHRQSMMIYVKKIVKKYGIWIALIATLCVTTAYLLKKSSADGRLFIDKICIMTICNNGLKGAGPGHFGGAYGETQANYFYNQIKENGSDELDWTVINEKERLTAECPGNAFNEYLYIGVEYGPIVMLLSLLVIITAILISFMRGGVWCYGLIAFAVFAFFSYPLHVKQFQLLIPLLLVACISEGNSTYKREEISCLVVFMISISFIYKQLIPNIRQYEQAVESWKELKHWYELEYYDYVVEDAGSLLPFFKNDYYFLYAYGRSLNKTGRYDESDTILRLGTKISCNPMFWNLLGSNNLARGKIDEAENLFKHAFYMVPNRLYPLTLLAKLYHEEGDMVRFKHAASIVESFIPKIDSVTTDSLRNDIRKLY